MNRSYLKYLAAVLVLVALVLPLAALMSAKALIAAGGEGIVLTKYVSVGGQVAFFFNMTGTTWRGPDTYIYISPNGNDFLTVGDTVLNGPFSTINVQYVTGNLTITASDILNFINNLEGNKSYPGATNAATVYNELKTQHWALVYLKIATALPSPTYTPPAIAAGPFNLSLEPGFEVVPSWTPYMSYYNCSVNYNEYGVNSFYQQTITLQFFVYNFASNLQTAVLSNKINFTVVASTFKPTSTLATFLSYNVKTGNYGRNYSSSVFSYWSPKIFYPNNSLVISLAALNPDFAPPYLQEIYSTYLYGFNASSWSLNEYGNSTLVPGPVAGQYTFLINNGKYIITNRSIWLANLTYSLTNVNFSAFTPQVNGFLDIIPSFEFVGYSTGVAGPISVLNPDDLVDVVFANMPVGSQFASLQAVGNKTLLPSEPIAVYEWNEGEWANLSKFYLDRNMTNLTGSVSGDVAKTVTNATVKSVTFVIPNAPFGLPYSYLGLYPGFTYNASFANGSIVKESAYVYSSNVPTNCPCITLGLCPNGYTTYHVYPFIQVFTSDDQGLFYAYPSLLLGNYLLVRGFGFSSNTSQPINVTSTLRLGYAWTVLGPEFGTLKTDVYGDFVYVTQLPYTGTWADAVDAQGSPTTTVTVPTTISLELPYNTHNYSANISQFYVVLPTGLGDALIYVKPTPTTWDVTSWLWVSGTYTTIAMPSPPVNSSVELDLPNIYGAIYMPANQVRFPFEATQLIVNGTTQLIPTWQGGLEYVEVVGAPYDWSMPLGPTVIMNFTLRANSSYFNSVNLNQLWLEDSSYFTAGPVNGYANISFLPVPDLPGTITYYGKSAYGYNLSLSLGYGEQSSEPAYTELFTSTAAEILIQPADFDLATLIVNHTSSTNPLGLTSLYTSYASGSATTFLYIWPPYAMNEVPYLFVLPNAQFLIYVFGSPVSYPTTTTLPSASPYKLPVHLLVKCGSYEENVSIGYIVNGTLWSPSFPGYFKPSYKGGLFVPVQSLCYTGMYTLGFQIVGPWVPTPVVTPVPHVPWNISIYYMAPNQIPAEPVSISVVGSGSTANAEEPYMVLVPTQVPIFGLQPSVAQYFFSVSPVSIQAYVLSSSMQAWPLPASDISGPYQLGNYYVYYVYLPSNVTEGQLVVVASETAKYYFTDQTYSGTAAAEMGIVPPVNSTAIESVVKSAVQAAVSEVLVNVTKQIEGLQSALSGQITTSQQAIAKYMAGNFTQALLSLKAVQQALAAAIAENANAIETSVSTIGVGQQAIAKYMAGNFSELSSELTSAQETLSGYLAGNFSKVLAYLASINSTLSGVSKYLPHLSTLVANLQSVSAYLYGNFSAINSTLASIQGSISNLEGDVTAVGSEVGSVGANVLTLLHDAQTLSGYAEATLSYLSSMNSTLTGMSSTLGSVSSTVGSESGTLSSLSSKADSIASTLGSVSSTLGSIQSTLTSMSSTLSTVSSGVSSASSTLGSIQSTLSTISTTASNAYTQASNAYSESQHVASLASSAATYALAALVVAIIALALIAYVAFAKF